MLRGSGDAAAAAAAAHMAGCLTQRLGGPGGVLATALRSLATSSHQLMAWGQQPHLPEPWSTGDFACTPAVQAPRPGAAAPTALAWLRLRPPTASPLLAWRLQQLFRQRQVRVLGADGKVRVARSGRELAPGELLFAPRPLLEAAAAGDGAGGGAAPPAPRGARRDGGGGGGDEWHGAARGRRGEWDEARQSGAGGGGAAARTARWQEDGQQDGRSWGRGGDAEEEQQQRQRQPEERRGAPAAAPAPVAAGGLPVVTPELVRSWVLAATRDWFVLNKPAGVECHGPGRHSLSRALVEALGGGAWEAHAARRRRAGGAPAAGADPGAEGAATTSGGGGGGVGRYEEPRLAHRLDMRTSGCLMVARGADAAAWLALCFRGRTAAAAAGLDAGAAGTARAQSGRGGGARAARGPGGGRGGEEAEKGEAEAALEGLAVERVYYAVVQGSLRPRDAGRLRSRINVEGVLKPAVTRFEVLASRGGLSLLRLSPATGRKHQLRVHCAQLLGAPILGDYRYGYRETPDAADSAAAAARPPGTSPPGGAAPDAAAAFAEGDEFVPLYLHAHSLALRQPGRRAARVVAPLPRHMRGLLRSLAWQLPKADLAPPSVGGRRAPAAAAAGGRARRGAGVVSTKRGMAQWQQRQEAQAAKAQAAQQG
ncbi:MAG: pseudouridine synthase [Monoraphidium minutum]|nr:MAG: pseudouridine synthase [Monoraphidium minutum]